MMKHYILPVMLALLGSDLFAQQTEVTEPAPEMTLEELMNITIVSASRTEESTFSAPITSFVITHQDLQNSGATSIPEALRIAPGVIVHELANGSYDVSIRGGKDNLPSSQYDYINTSILAMIDGRPVFNYLAGGTYWQNLPVDLADVDQIEIVYGPSAPLYGPNAVDGVINIITRKANTDETTYGNASIQTGNNNIFSALVGTRISEKWEVNVSANATTRKRDVTEFYDLNTSTFVSNASQLTGLGARPYDYFPDPDVSIRRNGANFNLIFTPAAKTSITLNSGYNDNRTISGVGAVSTINQMSNSSFNHMLKAEVKNFTLQTSILSGRQSMMGSLAPYNYDYRNIDSYLDYNLKINDRLSVRPALTYQNAEVDDRKYTVNINQVGIFNNRATMYNYAASLKADYSPFNALRIIAAIRADRFKAPDKTYISYQGIVNYNLNGNNIVRLLMGRSYAGSFINPTYANYSVAETPAVRITAHGSENLKLLQNNVIEVGYRSHITKTINIDVTVFDQRYSDFAAQLTEVVKEPVLYPELQQGEYSLLFQNVGLKSHQQGTSLSVNMFFGKINIHPFFTWQRTRLGNYSPYTYHTLYYATETDKNSDFAPQSFGGFYLNVPMHKFNIYVSSYYYSQYKLITNNNIDQTTGELISRAIDNIDGKVLVNAKIGYNASSNFNVFINGRNLLRQNAREGYGSDLIGRMIFLGLNINI